MQKNSRNYGNRKARSPWGSFGEPAENQKADDNTLHDLCSYDILFVTSSVVLKKGLPKLLEKVVDVHASGKSRICVVLSDFAYRILRQISEKGQEPETAVVDQLGEVFSKLPSAEVRKGNSKNVFDEQRIVRDYVRTQSEQKSIIVLSCDRVLGLMLSETLMETHVFSYLMDVSEEGYLTDSEFSQSGAVFQPPLKAETTLENIGVFRGQIPRNGDYIRTESGGSFRLEEQIGKEGAEGKVYAVSQSHCVKIFRSSHNTGIKIKKIRQLCEVYPTFYEKNPSLMKRIAFPEQVVYSSEGYAVGFIMRRFHGTVSLEDFDFSTVQEYLPEFSKYHQVTMAISLAELAVFCAENYLFLGDILNPQNILYDQNQNAYLIDIDSCEFTSDTILYPADNRKRKYFPPERIKCKDYDFQYRSEDDVWTLQTLLFLLLVSENPYVREENFPMEDNIYYGRYPYQSGLSDRTNGIKTRQLYDIMTHIPAFLRNDFYHSFSLKGKNFIHENRFDAQKWLRDCVLYRHYLPQIIEHEQESQRLFPNHRKIRYEE